MPNLTKRIWLLPLFLLFMAALVPRGNALEPYLALYPPEGSVLDVIRLEYRAEFNAYEGIWIYYDDLCIASDLSQTFGVPPVYGLDYDFSPPNRHPYNDLGIHNVTLIAWTGDPLPEKFLIMNATFEIVQYVPCPEYQALNTSYFALLARYNSLNSSYNALLTQYNDLNNTYQDLLADYNTKLANYGSLSNSYDSLCIQYDSLEANYNSLQSNNGKLATSYNDLVGELTSARYLGYVFIAATMILLTTTVYFAFRKPKEKTT